MEGARIRFDNRRQREKKKKREENGRKKKNRKSLTPMEKATDLLQSDFGVSEIGRQQPPQCIHVQQLRLQAPEEKLALVQVSEEGEEGGGHILHTSLVKDPFPCGQGRGLEGGREGRREHAGRVILRQLMWLIRLGRRGRGRGGSRRRGVTAPSPREE